MIGVSIPPHKDSQWEPDEQDVFQNDFNEQPHGRSRQCRRGAERPGVPAVSVDVPSFITMRWKFIGFVPCISPNPVGFIVLYYELIRVAQLGK